MDGKHELTLYTTAAEIIGQLHADNPAYDAMDFSGLNGNGRYVQALVSAKRKGTIEFETLLRGFKHTKPKIYEQLTGVTQETVEKEAQAEEEQAILEEIGKNIVLMSNVVHEDIKWLWYGRLALGKVHMLDGDPGLGKSSLLYDLAARITKGACFPFTQEPVGKGGAVFISLEDGIADTMQPRLDRAGAVLSSIASVKDITDINPKTGKEYTRIFSLETDMPVLEEAIRRVDAKLVVIDPIMTLLGSKNTYKDNEVRAALAPLVTLAEQMGVAIILVRHVNKGGNDKLIYQGGGSIGFIGLARIGLMAIRCPEDENQVVFVVAKNNLAPKSDTPSLLYRVVNDNDLGDGRAYIKWDGLSTLTDQDLARKTTPAQEQGKGRKEILAALQEAHPEVLGPQQIADKTQLLLSNVKMTLSRMVEDGQINKVGRGEYTAQSGVSNK